MSAQILIFPGAPPQLQLEGYTFIAWSRDMDGWFFGLWKPTSGKGWYEWGYYVPALKTRPGDLTHSRMSKSKALSSWRRNCKNFAWHGMMSETQAFPPKRRQYMRPPRISRRHVPSMA